VLSALVMSNVLRFRKNPKHFEEFAHPSLKSPVNDDDDDDLDESTGKKTDFSPSGGRQKRAAALKQKGV